MADPHDRNDPSAMPNSGQQADFTGTTPAVPPGVLRERQTGKGTAPPQLDVVDPHASNEQPPASPPRPGAGGQRPIDTGKAHGNIGPNDAAHNGSAPPRPHNMGSGPE